MLRKAKGTPMSADAKRTALMSQGTLLTRKKRKTSTETIDHKVELMNRKLPASWTKAA